MELQAAAATAVVTAEALARATAERHRCGTKAARRLKEEQLALDKVNRIALDGGRCSPAEEALAEKASVRRSVAVRAWQAADQAFDQAVLEARATGRVVHPPSGPSIADVVEQSARVAVQAAFARAKDARDSKAAARERLLVDNARIDSAERLLAAGHSDHGQLRSRLADAKKAAGREAAALDAAVKDKALADAEIAAAVAHEASAIAQRLSLCALVDEPTGGAEMDWGGGEEADEDAAEETAGRNDDSDCASRSALATVAQRWGQVAEVRRAASARRLDRFRQSVGAMGAELRVAIAGGLLSARGSRREEQGLLDARERYADARALVDRLHKNLKQEWWLQPEQAAALRDQLAGAVGQAATQPEEVLRPGGLGPPQGKTVGFEHAIHMFQASLTQGWGFDEVLEWWIGVGKGRYSADGKTFYAEGAEEEPVERWHEITTAPLDMRVRLGIAQE
mmetsp:Transcript_38052/g.101194  ORF Transcript_38052/g.101194 Transcript_38052/m.101194 type:complete len:454 (-) Transcript_38052:328-1689(-)